MLLMQAPKLMLLDEPVAGLTRAERDRTSALLHSVQERCAILIVEHDMAFVRQFDATVTVLHQGRVLVEGPMGTVQNDERVIEVYLGRARRGRARRRHEPSLLELRRRDRRVRRRHRAGRRQAGVAPGQAVCLLGRNGVGKTTLVKTRDRLAQAARTAGAVRRPGHHPTGAERARPARASATCRRGGWSFRS